MCPNRRLSTPTCPDCRGYGPHARTDGHKYDSAGLDFPCPTCGTTARKAMLREKATPQETDRDLAIDALIRCPELVHFARELGTGEQLQDLARSIVETAHEAGLSHINIALVPWDALKAARRSREALWRRACAAMAELAIALQGLPDDELRGQIVQLEERAALIDPRDRPPECEASGCISFPGGVL